MRYLIQARILAVVLTLFCSRATSLQGATIVLLTGENEYGTGQTLPTFAKEELEPMGHRILHVAAPEVEGEHRFENIEALSAADLIIVSVRRRAPQKAVIDALRAHIAAGKPVIGLRTASHAFELRKGAPPPGHADWPSFDTEVLGGDYQDHWSNKLPEGPSTTISVAKENATHPILAGIETGDFKVTSHLYKSRNLSTGTKVLLWGRVDGQQIIEPVAWTMATGERRVFYTSLGSKEDFQLEPFRVLLRNGILWALADKAQPQWADWVEPGFPFFSSVLDARSVTGAPNDNLTPRGLVLQLGHDLWACFDIDLLRIAAVWRGKGVTPRALAPGSYQAAGTKTLEGQRDLPKPEGTLWLANGLYPGVQTSSLLSFEDPRPPAPSPEEPGRGALPYSLGRFRAVKLTNEGMLLEYDAAGGLISEAWRVHANGTSPIVERRLRIEGTEQPITIVIGREPAGGAPVSVGLSPEGVAELAQENGTWLLRIPQVREAVELSLTFALGRENLAKVNEEPIAKPARGRLRWPEEITTSGIPSLKTDAFVVDDLPLPLTNPWHRNMRLADLAFFRDGTAAAVTFDGDVWLIKGLAGGHPSVRWRRFASGLHEPLGIVIRDESVFVFDRNGLWHLPDLDSNGEADANELFSNAVAQTAETREFPNGIRLAPDGSFVLAKGGQQGATLGKHNGTILRVSPDGKGVEVLASGLRQPFIGVHPKTGLITASDQQGHYVPSTPLHIVEGGRFYGFLPSFLPKEQYPAPIAEPLTWMPHTMNASAAGQVWLTDAKMGALNDALIHIGYNRPELFLVRIQERGSRPQAAVLSLTRALTFSPLAGAVNPVDGQLYVTGFQVWGTTAPRISGLARIRSTGAPNPLPREIIAMDKGMLLRFDSPLDPVSVRPENFTAERWNYRRTAQYGSPHLRLDGTPGQEVMNASSAYLALDGRSVFVGLADMKPVMQMRFAWSLSSESGAVANQAALTPHELIAFDPEHEGFGKIQVDLTPRISSTAAPATVEDGRKLYEVMGCSACHSTNGAMAGKVGPSWKGLAGARRELSDGSLVIADEQYLRESILQPAAKVPKGFQHLDAGMPIYEGVLNEAQVQALVLFIQSFSSDGKRNVPSAAELKDGKGP